MRFDDQFAEKGISPGEPFAGKISWIVLIKGFVHKTGACMGIFKPF